MSVTIDSLQIEIQSTSTSAAKGIDDLAKALGNLKTSGTVTTAIKNLNSLRNSLRMFNNIPSNASKVLSLARSLEVLKGDGSVSSVGNSLTKLATSLQSLDKVDVGNVAPQIQGIVDAVAPLSAVKSGGLSTMVNAMSKIGKVTADLDDEKIAAFAERVKKLTDSLTPLATKMTTIQAGLSGINTKAKSAGSSVSSMGANARSAGSSVEQLGDDVNATTLNLSSMIHVIQTVAQHCGIMDVHYFSKLFKKHTGKTPSQYRDETKG